MSLKDWINEALSLLGIVIWPVIVYFVIRFVQSKYPNEIRDLLRRMTEGPFGIKFGELQQKVNTIDERVKQIEEKITFEPSTALTPKLERELNSVLSSFRIYLQELGFEPKEGEVNVRIGSEIPGSAYYDPSSHQIVIAKDLDSKGDAALHEYTHHALLSITKGSVSEFSTIYQEIEAGLAIYFPCSFKNSALLANRWDLNQDKKFTREKFTEIRSSDRLIYIAQGEVWAAAIWQLRILLGRNQVDKLLFATWSALQPSDLQSKKRLDFARRLLESALSYGMGNHVDQIQAIFERCGLEF